MRVQDLLDGVVGLDVSCPAVKLDKENQVDLVRLHVVKELQDDFAFCDGFSGGVALIPVDIDDLVAMLMGVPDQVVFLRLQGITMHGLLFGGHADVQRGPQNLIQLWMIHFCLAFPGQIWYH